MVIKVVRSINGFNYGYIAERKGAHYFWYDSKLDCIKFGNAGDIYEVACKFVRGLDTHKDGNGSFIDGSDIESENTSCKSWKASLASTLFGNDKNECWSYFKSNVASNLFSFGWIEGEDLVEYIMDMDTFEPFIERFATYAKDRKTIRIAALSNSKRIEVERWLEERMA